MKVRVDTKPIDKIVLEVEKFRPFDLDVEGVLKLQDDIRKNGLLVPLTVWKRGNHPKFEYVLISGHHRLEALKNLGYKEVPCNIVEFESEEAAIIAAYAMNTQDEYSSGNRTWYDRFAVAEEKLRPVVEEYLRTKKGGKGKKAEKKERAENILCDKVGLKWSHTKYDKMRKIYAWLKNAPSSLVYCLKRDEDFSVNPWFVFVGLVEDGKITEDSLNSLYKFSENLVTMNQDFFITDNMRGFLKDIKIEEEKEQEKKEEIKPKKEKTSSSPKLAKPKEGEVCFLFSVLNDDPTGEEVCKIVFDALKNDKRIVFEHGTVDWSDKSQNVQSIKVFLKKKEKK